MPNPEIREPIRPPEGKPNAAEMPAQPEMKRISAERAQEDAERWKRFEEIGRELEKNGDKVIWNHPAEGPRNPIFILHSAPLSPDRYKTPSPETVQSLIGELKELSFLREQGLRKFAFEGHPATPMKPGQVILIPQGDDEYLLKIQDHRDDWRGRLPATSTLLTAEQVQALLSNENEDFLERILGRASSGTIARLFSSATADDPQVTCTGAESPKLFEAFRQRLDADSSREWRIRSLYNEFMRPALDQGGRFSYTFEKDGNGRVTHVMLLGKPYDADDLYYVLSHALGETPEQKLRDEPHERFASELDADVVHIGNEHLERLRTMKTQRSIGIIIPKESNAAYHKPDAEFAKRMIRELTDADPSIRGRMRPPAASEEKK
jgi:hypothetical protein